MSNIHLESEKITKFTEHTLTSTVNPPSMFADPSRRGKNITGAQEMEGNTLL
jgi:hypothetical protein